MKRMLGWLVRLWLAWVGLVILIVNPAINFVTDDYVSETLGLPFRTGTILVDPISFAVSVEGAELLDSNGTPLFQVARYHADLGLWRTLFDDGVTVSRVQITEPALAVSYQSDGTMNLQPLLNLQGANDDGEAQQEPVPGITLDQFTLTDGSMTFADPRGDLDYRAQVNAINIDVTGITTLTGRAPMQQVLNLDLADGGSVHWQGQASLEGPALNGVLQLDALTLIHHLNYLIGDLPVSFTDSTLFSATVNLSHDPAASNIDIADAELLDLSIASNGNHPAKTPDSFGIQRFAVTSVAVDLSQNEVNLDGATIDGLSLVSTLTSTGISLVDELTESRPGTEDSTVELASQTKPEPKSESDADGEAGAVAAGKGSPWQVSVTNTALTAGDIRLASDLVKSGTAMATDIAIGLDAFSWPTEVESNATLSARYDETALISVQSTGGLLSGDLAVALSVEGFPLEALEPVVGARAPVSLAGGRTDFETALTLDAFAPVNSTAELLIRDFTMADRANQEPMVAFSRLQVSAIEALIPEQTLSINAVSLAGAEASLLIRQDGTINFSEMIDTQGTAPAERADPEADTAAETEPHSEAAATDDAASVPAEAEPTWQLSVATARVLESQLRFRDEALPVKFTAVIDELSLTAEGFDTRTDTTLNFEGMGLIDGYAPVDIEGQLGHFSEPSDGQFRLDMSGIDIARLTPYSATFLGYPIERGVLATDIDYELEGGRVIGRNGVRVEDLKLGDKTSSDSAIDLPIKTAVALLTDASGAIDMNLGIEGDVDDPEFKVWSALWQAAGTMIGNIVAAPFKLLASLAGEDAISETVRFSVANTTLDETARSGLTSLADALTQRPQLRLLLRPGIHRKLDVEKLQRQAFDQSLLDAGLTPEDLETKSPAWEAKLQSLAKIAGLDAELPPSAARQSLSLEFPVADSTLNQLALERATSIKRFMVTELESDPQQVVIAPWDETSADLLGVTLDVEAR